MIFLQYSVVSNTDGTWIWQKWWQWGPGLREMLTYRKQGLTQSRHSSVWRCSVSLTFTACPRPAWSLFCGYLNALATPPHPTQAHSAEPLGFLLHVHHSVLLFLLFLFIECDPPTLGPVAGQTLSWRRVQQGSAPTSTLLMKSSLVY